MGGKKTHILPKEVISHTYRCICGSDEITEYAPGKMLCPHCRRYFEKEIDNGGAFVLKGFLCHNSSEGTGELFPLEGEYKCLGVQDELIGAFSPDSKSDKKYLFCVACLDQHITFYDEMIQEGKKNLSTFKRRLTRMRHKQEYAICRVCFKKVLLVEEIEAQKCIQCIGDGKDDETERREESNENRELAIPE